MVRCPVPVIAAVSGSAVGLGCDLALLSDLALRAEGTYLADPHVRLDLANRVVPGGKLLDEAMGLPRSCRDRR